MSPQWKENPGGNAKGIEEMSSSVVLSSYCHRGRAKLSRNTSDIGRGSFAQMLLDMKDVMCVVDR